jgi:hypothetical protein
MGWGDRKNAQPITIRLIPKMSLYKIDHFIKLTTLRSRALVE